MCAPKSAPETCPQRVFSPHPWLVWLFSESLIPGAPHLHLCCPSRSARLVFLLRGLVFLLRISYSRTFFHFHPHPCSFLCIRGASPTAQQTLTPAFMRDSCPPLQSTPHPPIPTPSSHGPSLPPAHCPGGSHSTALFPREQCVCVTDNNVLSSQALPRCTLGHCTKGALCSSGM